MAQIGISKDSTQQIIEKSPAFTIYKDNYFISGIPLNEKADKYNSDAKFQFSFKYRLRKKPIFWDIDPYLTYTQKSFWDIYRKSSPFAETNYNPGILLIKPLFQNGDFFGVLTMSVEHESNGRDSIFSRSWNFVSLGYTKIFSGKVNASLKLWAPFGLSDNPELTDYIGYGEAQVSWMPIRNRLFLDITGRVGRNFDKGSVVMDVSWRPFPKGNEYITLQWWQGHAENLVDYQKNTSMIRIGLVLKPIFMRFY
nr:phospholipase A [Allomuricauda sp.]